MDWRNKGESVASLIQYAGGYTTNAFADVLTLKRIDYNTIKVEGMTCSHCEESIVKTIMQLKGVENVFADAKKGEVRVLANDDINQEINAAINQLGFKVIDDFEDKLPLEWIPLGKNPGNAGTVLNQQSEAVPALSEKIVNSFE